MTRHKPTAEAAPQKPAADAMREAVKRAVCCPDGCQYEGDSEDGGTCYCDTTDYHGSGVEKRANAVFASLSAPVPPPDGPSYGDMRAKIGLYAMLLCIGDPDKTDHDVARILREYAVAIREFAGKPRLAALPPDAGAAELDDVRSALADEIEDRSPQSTDEGLISQIYVTAASRALIVAALRSAPVSAAAPVRDREALTISDAQLSEGAKP